MLQVEGLFTSIGKDSLDRCAEIAYEDHQVVVVFVNGEPGTLLGEFLEPLSEQGRFARSGLGGDEGEFAVYALIESPDQMGACDQILTELRPVKFRLYQNWSFFAKRSH
jgi:hypothetical protein